MTRLVDDEESFFERVYMFPFYLFLTMIIIGVMALFGFAIIDIWGEFDGRWWGTWATLCLGGSGALGITHLALWAAADSAYCKRTHNSALPWGRR